MALYVVATPLGNLEDITLRALRVLKEADLIAAEDTRRTRTLLARYGIATPTTSYFEHNKARKGPALLRLLGEGKTVALVTDAGTPGISDPGADLVRAAREAGIPVIPVPGPSAVTAALSVAGVPGDRFVFEGFLPARAGRRLARLRELLAFGRTVVLYEGPHRVAETLEAIGEVFGPVELILARELTKQFEEIRRGTSEALLAAFQARGGKGEVTLIIPAALPRRGAHAPQPSTPPGLRPGGDPHPTALPAKPGRSPFGERLGPNLPPRVRGRSPRSERTSQSVSQGSRGHEAPAEGGTA